jgi:hypothetical protein
VNPPNPLEARGVLAFVVSALAALVLLCPAVARGDRHVRPDGVDSGDCASPAQPCATIGYAVGTAVDGDLVRVARGSYSGGAEVGSKSLTIQGGWSRDFTWRDPDPGSTVLDSDGIGCTSWGSYLLTVEGLTIQNASVGVRAINECTVRLESAVLKGNESGLTVSGGPDLSASARNTFFVGNTRAIVLDASVPNATISFSLNGSTLTGNGTGLDCSASGMPSWFVVLQATVVSSILYGNDVVDLRLGGSLYATCLLRASYSDIGVVELGSGSPCTYLPEAGLIAQDPGFLESGDFHLGPLSPCLDVGNPASTLAHDLDGEPRPFDANGDGTAVGDIGADEYWDRPAGPVVFWDDLESGDAGAWSSSVP